MNNSLEFKKDAFTAFKGISKCCIFCMFLNFKVLPNVKYSAYEPIGGIFTNQKSSQRVRNNFLIFDIFHTIVQ